MPTIGEWLSILSEVDPARSCWSPPFFESFGKRLIKSPKLFFVDSGLACHLLGLESVAEVERSPFRGPLFEGFVGSEILKQQQGAGRRREIYYFRDQQGLVVDFVVPMGGGRLALVEAKASRTVRPEAGETVARLARATRGSEVQGFVVHQPRGVLVGARRPRPGVRALPLGELLAVLGRR